MIFTENIAGIRIRIRSGPLIFGLPDPDPYCNNGNIKLSKDFLDENTFTKSKVDDICNSPDPHPCL